MFMQLHVSFIITPSVSFQTIPDVPVKVPGDLSRLKMAEADQAGGISYHRNYIALMASCCILYISLNLSYINFFTE